MKTSTFLSLTKKDWIKGLIMAIAVPMVTGLLALITNMLNTLQGGTPINWPSVKIQLMVLALLGISGLLSYVLKNFLTNSSDQFLKKES